LKSFLQASTEDKEEFSLRSTMKASQPQASSSAYSSSSGGIVTILEETKDKAEGELSDARKAEMEAKHEFDMVRQSLENEIGQKKEKLGQVKHNKAAADQAKAAAAGEKATTEKTKAEDAAYLSTLQRDCQQKAVEWEERLKSAKGEIGALDKATEILQAGVKALIQVSVKRSTRSHRAMIMRDPFADSDDDESAVDEDKRTRFIDVMRTLSRKYNSFAFTQITNRAKAGDPMEKIRGLIEEMISKLTAEAAEEANQKAFCDEEMGKSKKALGIKGMKLEKLSARIDQGSTRKLQLLEEVKGLEGDVAEIDRANAEATNIRQQEHTEFKKAQSDYKSSENACAQAVEVLKQYYSGAALLQIQSATRRSTSRSRDESQAPGSDAGASIIQFLEFAQGDFAKLLAEVENSEDVSATAFQKLAVENKVAKATKQAEAKGKESEVKQLTNSLNDSNEDKDGLSKEVDAVSMYLEKLKPECETKVMSADERMAARKAEIEGLKEALSILSGSSV